jgi:hypothetical protein
VRLLLEVRIRSSSLFLLRWCVPHRWITCGVVYLADLLGSSQFSCSLEWFQAWLSKGLIFDNGCCSGALVLWGLSIKTSRMSTITSFPRLW